MPTLRFAPDTCPARPAVSTTLGIVAVPMLLSGAVYAAPLAAQAIGRVEIGGHVAPRCWSLAPTRTDAATLANPDSRSSIAARCNHVATPISVHVRMLPPIATEREAQPVANEIPPSRAAIEIVLSPTL